MSTQPRIQLEYASGLSGAGKTTFLTDVLVAQNFDADKIIIVKPTIDLCSQTGNKLKQLSRSLPVRVINHKTTEESDDTVASRIADAIKIAGPEYGQIIICTQQSFFNVPVFANKEDWTVLWDEEFDPTEHIDRRFDPEHQNKYVFDICSQVEQIGDYATLGLDKHKLHKIQERIKSEDEVFKLFDDIHQKLYDCHAGKFDLFLHKKYLNTNRLAITCVRNPNIFRNFKRVVMFGARFEDSLMFNVWKELYDVEWIPMREWTESYHEVLHQSPVEFYYAVENHNHSKNTITRILDCFLADCKVYLENEQTLFLGNKEQSKLKLKATELPFGCYGLNDYSTYVDLVYTGAFNKTPSFYQFLNDIGIQSNFSAHHFYQSVMRTALRKQEENKTPVRVFTPCLTLIEQVKHVFTNHTIHKMQCADECMKLLHESDGRRKPEVKLEQEWYLLKKKWLIEKIGIPEHIVISDAKLVRWFEDRGYKLETIETVDQHWNKQVKKIFCQFPDSLEKALVALRLKRV